jgi:hypothetical protein
MLPACETRLGDMKTGEASTGALKPTQSAGVWALAALSQIEDAS